VVEALQDFGILVVARAIQDATVGASIGGTQFPTILAGDDEEATLCLRTVAVVSGGFQALSMPQINPAAGERNLFLTPKYFCGLMLDR